jgi:hypothetical protein
MESYVGAVLVDNQGSKTEKYFLPSKDGKVCETFKKGTSVRALVGFACCDGDSNPPCFLGFGRYVARIPLLGFLKQTQNRKRCSLLQTDMAKRGAADRHGGRRI